MLDEKNMMNNTKRFLLKRFRADDCVMGRLVIEYSCTQVNRNWLITVERPYLDNKPFISCVPDGEYILKPVNSAKYGQTYFIESLDLENGVPVVGLAQGKRTGILFHIGNTIDDSTGCIILGKSCGVIKGKRAVLNSGKAVREFNREMDGYHYRLSIMTLI